MDYAWKIDTDHSTYTEAEPLVSTLQLTRGRLVGGFLYFPAGPAGKLHLVVLRGLHQILPANQDSNYALNDCVIPFFLDLALDQPPYTLDALTWNKSTTEEHTLTLGLVLAPFADLSPRKSFFSRLLGRE